MITAEQIEEAKKRTAYAHPGEVHHQHDDCIRIAYEWLDAQTKTKGTTRTARALKHLIEDWGGRYVSQSDVEVAAALHPAIKGRYPYYNISKKSIRPSELEIGRNQGSKDAELQNQRF